MSKKATNENREHIDESDDESKIDWSGFGELVMRMYQDQMKEGIPPEIKGIKTVDEFKNYLERT